MIILLSLYVRCKFQNVSEGSQRFQKVPEVFLEPEDSGKAQRRFREGSEKVYGRFREVSWEV